MNKNNNERKDALLMEVIAEALVRQKRSSRILVKVDAEGTSLTLGGGEHQQYALPFTGLWVGKEPGSSIRYSKGGAFAGCLTDLFYDLQRIPFLDEWDGIMSLWEQQFCEQSLPNKEGFHIDHFDNGLAYRAFLFTPKGKEEIEGREEDVELGTEGVSKPAVNIRKDPNTEDAFLDFFAEYDLI